MKLFTFVISRLFACKVARAAHTTKALELDKPLLFGTVPKRHTLKPKYKINQVS